MPHVEYDAVIHLKYVNDIDEDDLVEGTVEQIKRNVENGVMTELEDYFDDGGQTLDIRIDSNLNVEEE